MIKWIRNIVIILSCSLTVAVVLSGCSLQSSSAPETHGKIQVVAAEDFYGEVARAVGGRYVQVVSVINKPSMDPHDYEPTIATARSVSDAKLIISNGLGYDGWIDKLIQNKGQVTVHVGEDLMKKRDGDNEHLWYKPETMPKLAADLAEKMAVIDPEHAQAFKDNARKYSRQIGKVKKEIAQLRKKSRQKPVDVSEPVFNYMLQALGYKINNSHFAVAVDQGSDPSPGDIASMEADIRGKRIAFFVSNIQNDDPVVNRMVALCRQYRIPVVKVTETLPAGQDYQSWMMGQLKQVERIQNGSADSK